MAPTADKKKKKISEFFFKVENVPDTSTISAAPTPVTPAVTIPGLPVAHEDAKIKEQLSSALALANMEGYDYFEFAQAVEAQTAIIPSEAVRFQSAFASAKVMGVTADKLLSSNQHYLDVLKKKEDEFNQALEGHKSEAITAKTEAIAKMDKDMQDKLAQIQKINEEINALQQQKTAMTNEISQSQSEIAQVKNNFDATMRVFVDRINSDKEKIKTYLKTA